MENVINEYIAEYKKNVIKTIKEFGYIPDLEKVEEIAENRKNTIINAFEYGIDASRGLVAKYVKPVDIIKKENKFYFVVVLNKKNYLYGLDFVKKEDIK